MVLCLMITRIREWPELQMRNIKQNFMLTQVRGFPKKTASLSCVLLPFLESPGQSTLVGLKRPTITTYQEGLSGVEEIACSGGHVAGVWRNQGKVPGEQVKRRHFSQVFITASEI